MRINASRVRRTSCLWENWAFTEFRFYGSSLYDFNVRRVAAFLHLVSCKHRLRFFAPTTSQNLQRVRPKAVTFEKSPQLPDWDLSIVVYFLKLAEASLYRLQKQFPCGNFLIRIYRLQKGFLPTADRLETDCRPTAPSARRMNNTHSGSQLGLPQGFNQYLLRGPDT